MTYFSVKKTYWKSAIKPVAHIYYWLLDGNGGYFKSLCGHESAAKNGLLPAIDTVSVCVSCQNTFDRPASGHRITVERGRAS